MLHILILLHIIHCRPKLHMGPHFTYDYVYRDDTIIYFILSIKYLITSANTLCKLPEVGVRTPKHDVVILNLIFY
jgi:cadmium resistance protein CadD (predicted permease)